MTHPLLSILGNAPRNLSAQATQALASDADASLARALASTLASAHQSLGHSVVRDCPSVFDGMLRALKPAMRDVDLMAVNEMVVYLTRSWL
jgi:hypothetical protein